MKTVFTVILLVLLALPAAPGAQQPSYPAPGFALKAGLDLTGDHEVSAYGRSITTSTEGIGISLAAELFLKANRHVDIGAGAILQNYRELENDNGEFQFIPVYGTLRLRAGRDGIDPFVFGQMGYNVRFDGDDTYTGNDMVDLKGGLYYGGGIGAITGERFLIEVMYSVNEGTGRVPFAGLEGDIRYSRLSMNFGFVF